jgi:hypothetical protein
MLAALDHARGTLRRPEEVEAELARLRAQDAPVETADATPAAADEALDALDALDAPDAAEESGAPADATEAAVDADLLPPTAEHDRDDISDVIALTPVRAHNAQAGI